MRCTVCVVRSESSQQSQILWFLCRNGMCMCVTYIYGSVSLRLSLSCTLIPLSTILFIHTLGLVSYAFTATMCVRCIVCFECCCVLVCDMVAVVLCTIEIVFGACACYLSVHILYIYTKIGCLYILCMHVRNVRMLVLGGQTANPIFMKILPRLRGTPEWIKTAMVLRYLHFFGYFYLAE